MLDLFINIFLASLLIWGICMLVISLVWVVLLTLNSEIIDSLRKKFRPVNKRNKQRSDFTLRKVE